MQKPSYYISKKIKIKQGIIAAILSVTVYLLIAIIFGYLFYRLIILAVDFKDYLPQLFEKINFLKEKLEVAFKFLPNEFNFASLIETAITKLTITLGGYISSIAKFMPSFLLSSLVALVASCYIAKDFNRLLRFVKELCGKRITENFIRVKKIFFESVFKLIKGYLILSFLAYIVLTIGLLILRVKYAPIIAIFIALVDILPVIGVGTVMVPWAVISVFLGNYNFAVGITILYSILLLVRNFSEPKIIGGQIGINPLFTLLAIFIGFKIFGVIGLILFPITLIVVIRYYKDELEEGLSQ